MSEYDNIQSLTLREAVRLYQKEVQPVPFSYGWYIFTAEKKGQVLFSNFPVPVQKEAGTWYVNRKKFEAAICQHRQQVENRHQVTEDYLRGVLHGREGQTVEGEWLAYTIRGHFHLVRTEYDHLLGNTQETWYCNQCHAEAKTERDKEECSLCQNSKSCGQDCTLSRVSCPVCGASLEL